MMDWNKLKYFYHAAKAGSFTLAGKQLGIDPSVLGRQVNSLEETLGTKLYERHFRGITLTQDGEALFESARTAYRELELAEAKIKGRDDKVEGKLRIASTIGLSSDWLPEFIPGFLERYPGLQLSIISHTENLDLQAREADAVICPALSEMPDIVQIFLKTFYFGLYASAEYLRQFGTPETLEDISQHHLITFSSDPKLPFYEADSLLHLGLSRDKKREPFLEINTNAGLVNLAEKGLGIVSLWKEASYVKRSQLLEILPEKGRTSVDVFYIYPKRMENIRRVTAFGRYIKEILEKDHRA